MLVGRSQIALLVLGLCLCSLLAYRLATAPVLPRGYPSPPAPSLPSTGFYLNSLTKDTVLLEGRDGHNRPMVVSIQRRDFDKMFGRVWVVPLTPSEQER